MVLHKFPVWNPGATMDFFVRKEENGASRKQVSRQADYRNPTIWSEEQNKTKINLH